MNYISKKLDIFLDMKMYENTPVDRALQATFCWLLEQPHIPEYVILADKQLYLRLEKFATVLTILAPDTYVGEKSLVGFRGSNLRRLCQVPDFKMADLRQIKIAGLVR